MTDKEKQELEEYRKLGTPEELRQIQEKANQLVDALNESGLFEAINYFLKNYPKRRSRQWANYSTRDQ